MPSPGVTVNYTGTTRIWMWRRNFIWSSIWPVESMESPNSKRHNSTRPQLDTPQLYTDHIAVRLKLLYSSERYEQSVKVITIRQKNRNTNDPFVRTVRYSIVALTLWPYGLCRVVACRVVVVSRRDVSNSGVSSCQISKSVKFFLCTFDPCDDSLNGLQQRS